MPASRAGASSWSNTSRGDLHDTNYVNSYNSAMALEAVLKACGDDLSTENILKQAYAIKDLELPMLLPASRSTPRRPTTSRSTRCSSCASTARPGNGSGNC
jgi:hypothetical protein